MRPGAQGNGGIQGQTIAGQGHQQNTRQSIRSHSPGQNNFMGNQHKAVKIQRSQVQTNNGVFGTNNLMFGNYAPSQQQPGKVMGGGHGTSFLQKKQRGTSPYDRIK